jgi:hypothetical protein
MYRQLSDIRTDKESVFTENKRFAILMLHIGNEPVCGTSEILNAPSPCRPDYTSRSGLLSDALIALRSVINVRDFRVEYGLKDLRIQLRMMVDRSYVSFDPRGMTDEEVKEKEEQLDKEREDLPIDS